MSRVRTDPNFSNFNFGTRFAQKGIAARSCFPTARAESCVSCKFAENWGDGADELARRAYKAAVRFNPAEGDIAGLRARAIALTKLERKTEALTAWQKVLSSREATSSDFDAATTLAGELKEPKP
jgi:hypothetical protein